MLLCLGLGGLPFTGGAIAKYAVKDQLDVGVVGWLAAASAVGTTLLMLHFLRRLAAYGSEDAQATASTGLRWPWLAMAAAALVLPWLLYPMTGLGPTVAAIAPKALWASLWPVALGAGLAFTLRGWAERLPQDPAGRHRRGDRSRLARRAGPRPVLRPLRRRHPGLAGGDAGVAPDRDRLRRHPDPALDLSLPMTDPNTHDIHLDLADPRELFHPADLDPIGGQPYAEPGLERILNRIRPRPAEPVRATLRLPAAARTPDLEARMRSGLQRYCDHRIGQISNDIASLRQEGLATLWRGLLFLALCMLGSQTLGEPKFLPGILARFLDEGLIIAGWVALWYPLDALLYQHWPLKRERRLYSRCATWN